MKTKESFFTPEEEAILIKAIHEAEQLTSGEIKVHVEEHCFIDLLDRSAEVFAKLKMHETAERNGVLIYVAFEDHMFTIIGDKGINEVVEPNFWEDVKELMGGHFSGEELVEGLRAGVLKAGEKLGEFFPYKEGEDVNELPDDLSYG